MEKVQFNLDNLTLHGLKWGSPDKPLVFALHGWLDNANSFLPISDYLTDYQVIAIDLPGHGWSSHRGTDAHYHFFDWIQDMYELFQQQEWQQVYYLGHSMGGIIGTFFASVFPERVKKLICMESIGAYTKSEESTIEQIRESILSRVKMRTKKKRVHETIESAVTARASAGEFSREIAEILVSRNIEKLDDGYSWRTDQRLRTLSSLRLTEEQAKVILQGIDCETLIIAGEKGYDSVKQWRDSRLSVMKKGRFIELPGGHYLHMEQPEVVAEQIRCFFC